MQAENNKRDYGDFGYIDFSGFWEIMSEKGYNKNWLRTHGIHAATVQKLIKNENINCEVIARLCHLLDCQPGQIMKYEKSGSSAGKTETKA